MWAAGLTIGLVLIFVVLSSIIGIGWFLVLPMMFLVTLGAIITLVLLVAAGIAAASEDKAVKSPDRNQDGKSESAAATGLPSPETRSEKVQ
jgi:hypothetical protein